MKIECFLCSKVIPVQVSKKGLPWFYCDDCQFRGFINSEQGIAGLEAQGVDGEALEVKPKIEPTGPPVQARGPTPGVDTKQIAEAVMREVLPHLKAVDAEIKRLKAQANEPPGPKRKRKAAPKKPMTVGEYIEANA